MHRFYHQSHNKKHFLSFYWIVVCFGIFLILPQQSHPASSQIFSGLSFANPAELALIQKQQLKLYGTYIYQDDKFSGISAGGKGSAQSKQHLFLPEFRYSYRFNSKVVAGLKVTEPFAAKDDYGLNSILRYTVPKVDITTQDISPNISYALTKKFIIGFGLDSIHYQLNISSIIPSPSPLLPDAAFSNEGSDWGYGYHAGFLYRINLSTYVDAAYFSKTHFKLHGESYYPYTTSTNANISTDLPATTTLSLTHFFNTKFFMRGSLAYTQWHQVRLITIKNTALGNLPPLQTGYRNALFYMLAGHYQLKPHLGLSANILYEQSPTLPRRIETNGFDSDMYGMGVGLDFHPVKHINIAMFYDHLFSQNDHINNNRSPIIQTVGTANFSDNIIAIHFTWDY